MVILILNQDLFDLFFRFAESISFYHRLIFLLLLSIDLNDVFAHGFLEFDDQYLIFQNDDRILHLNRDPIEYQNAFYAVVVIGNTFVDTMGWDQDW